MALENQTRIAQRRGTKADCEAFTADLEEGALAFASDTGEIGIYTNGTWEWSARSDAVGTDHLHGLTRWAADGTATVYDLPDVAEYLEMIYNAGLAVDQATVSLSADGTQITFDAAPTGGNILQASYVIARI